MGREPPPLEDESGDQSGMSPRSETYNQFAKMVERLDAKGYWGQDLQLDFVALARDDSRVHCGYGITRKLRECHRIFCPLVFDGGTAAVRQAVGSELHGQPNRDEASMRRSRVGVDRRATGT